MRDLGRCRLLGGLLTTIVMAAVVGGCQSTTRVGDRYYDGGRLAEAAAAYQVYLESNRGDAERASQTLYRLGVIYASPGSSVHDPRRSIETLNRLLQQYPGNRYTTEALVLRDLQQQAIELESEVAADRTRLAELEADLVERERELRSLAGQIEEKEGQILALQESIPPLRVEISDLIHELAAKQAELEQLERLKAIDLYQNPP